MARKLIVEIVGDTRSVERAFRRAAGSADGFSRRIGRTTRGIARGLAALTATASGLAVLTGRSFASFEESLDRIVGLAGGATEQVDLFAQELLKLGPAVGKTPQELADSLYQVASAGIAVEQQMSVVTASAKAAASGLGDTATVADAVTSAMAAYGQSVLSAEAATDVLVATVREGKGEAAAFAPVIGTVAALASQLGVSFNEVGAALAAQTRLGTSAETAAIQLQAVFSSLLKTTPKSEEALESVGLTFRELRRELRERGLLALLGTLEDAFAGNTTRLAQAFPNIRALRGLLALVGKNAEDVRGVFDRMSDATGALGVAFGAVSEGEAFKFRQALAALQTVSIRLGAAFAPVAKKLAETLTSILIAPELTRALERFADQLAVKIPRAVDRTVTFFQQNWPAIRQFLQDAAEAARAFAAAIARITGAIRRAIDDTIGWKLAAQFLITGLIATKVARLATAFFSLAGPKGIGAAIGATRSLRGLLLSLPAVVPILIALKFSTEAIMQEGNKQLAQLRRAGDKELIKALLEQQIRQGTLTKKLAEQFASELKELLAETPALKALRAGAPGSPTARIGTLPTLPQTLIDDLVKQTAVLGEAADAAGDVSDAWQRLLDSLNLNLVRAQQTAGLADDLRALKDIQRAIRARIKEEGVTLDLQEQLLAVNEEIGNLRQFKALGLGPEGFPLIPNVKQLRTQLGKISDVIEGTFLDTGKTQGLLERIRKVLSGGLGKLSEEVRAKVKELLDDLRDQLEQGGVGPRTKFRVTNPNQLLEGLGLSADELRALKARLARVGPGGTLPATGFGAFGFKLPAAAPAPIAAAGGLTVQISGPLTVVTPNATAFLNDLQKKARRTSGSARGPQAGLRLGLG